MNDTSVVDLREQFSGGQLFNDFKTRGKRGRVTMSSLHRWHPYIVRPEVHPGIYIGMVQLPRIAPRGFYPRVVAPRIYKF